MKFINFSPRQQVIVAVCWALYGFCLFGAGFHNARQSLVGVPLDEPLPVDVGYIIDPSVDVNTASYEELQLLPSIGPVLAERILLYRERYEPFSSVDELQQIHGIGPKTVQKLKYYLEFED